MAAAEYWIDNSFSLGFVFVVEMLQVRQLIARRVLIGARRRELAGAG